MALRKARLLQSAGAAICVVAPKTSRAFAAFVRENSIALFRREFLVSDVEGKWLVVSATGAYGVEQAVFEASAAAGVFCNGVDDLRNCSFITPAIVDRSPIIVAISSGGTAPVLARKLREKIERLLPNDLGRLADLARSWRTRVTERLDTFPGRRRFWESVFDSDVASFAIGGSIDAAERRMARLLVDFAASPPLQGEAWLVGAGPGDPDLLTVRALQIMQTADVILHDRLVSDEVLALARRDADLISVGKLPGRETNTQETINQLLIAMVKKGKRVCRLKGGDPFIFGRGGEELEALRSAGLPCSVVPGITAAAGCAAAAGIPLTHRDVSQSVVFVAAHGKDSVDNLDWPSLARDRQTLAFFMAVRRFPVLMNKLIAHGRPPETPIAIVERGTLPEQRVVSGSLGQLAMLAQAQQIQAPAMLIVGDVAALADAGIVKWPDAQEFRAAHTPPICAKQRA